MSPTSTLTVWIRMHRGKQNTTWEQRMRNALEGTLNEMYFQLDTVCSKHLASGKSHSRSWPCISDWRLCRTFIKQLQHNAPTEHWHLVWCYRNKNKHCFAAHVRRRWRNWHHQHLAWQVTCPIKARYIQIRYCLCQLQGPAIHFGKCTIATVCATHLTAIS